MDNQPQPIDRIIRFREVLKITGLCRTTINYMCNRGDFPTKIQLGPRSVGFLESDIKHWIAERAKEAR